MSDSLTIDHNHGIVVQAARMLHNDILGAKGALGENAFRLGRLLSEMQESRAYTALGFATFEEYLASEEVGLHRATAYRFMKVFRAYQHVVHGRYWQRGIELRKLDILTRLIDEETPPEQVEALVEQAREIPRETLRAAVNEELRRKGMTPPDEYRPPARLAPPPPPPLLTPQAEEEQRRHVAFGEGVAGAVAADPEYRALVLSGKFSSTGHLLWRATADNGKLHEHVPPEEMARALPRDELERLTRDYERNIKPFLAWYEQVLELGRRNRLARVK